nr:ribonuclease H-like domain-containing protein [Tanacetum cinerariifolium]
MALYRNVGGQHDMLASYAAELKRTNPDTRGDGKELKTIMFGHMLLALEGKNKTGFIDGSCKRSNVDEVLGRQWDRVNVVVLGWILNSITDYYHGLNAVWKQFDCLIELPRCTCHATEGFKKHNQLMKLMQFLMGLDDSYMCIRSSILSRDPFPDRGQTSNNNFRPNTANNVGLRHNNSNVNRQNGSSGLVYDQLSTRISLIKDNTLTGNNVQANIEDNKIFVAFDENRCYFLNQDLNLKNVLGIGNQCGGLYYIDLEDYPGMPNDEESVDPSLNGDSRTNNDSGYSPVSGETVDTDDIPDTRIDADISNHPHATHDEKIKNLGKLKYFLGIEVIDTDKGICLNQRKYVLDLLTKCGMLACKPARTPMMSKLSISNEATNNGLFLDNIVDYQKLMRKLIYLTNTRSNISYVVYCLSQFMHAPLRSHLKSAFKILRYLNGSSGLGIHITRESGRSLKAYSDADWAKCTVTRKSVTGYCVFINNNLIS